MSERRGDKYLITFKRFLLKISKYTPLVLLILIAEGTFRTYSLYLLLGYSTYRVWIAVAWIRKTGQIDNIVRQLKK